ncbi:auxin efflux carrier [Cylindrobasidium torrendii FP15055 ss-10]|uniref:Auxin efflux carrier n=1 Tax=Cylindrobasidium torrendii FP15055 ss-10 TaxID=1314674 RepID=A0A0D7BR17_9AGAR|nr:auxin efflux carrier [Cylindrobasidium torrendii FP15055 ss-10]
MVAAGELIWIALRPLLRLVLCGSCGYALTKADILPAVSVRGVGQISLNVTIPCLMFSKMVPAFTSENIGAFGPAILICIIYQILGLLLAWITKKIFWIPHRFRWGIVVAGGWGNYGDIPIAVIMSICGNEPFNGTADQDVAVAYVSIFILYYMLTFFFLGGSKICGWDFIGPDVEPEDVRENLKQKRRAVLPGIFSRNSKRQSASHDTEEQISEKQDTADPSVIRQRPKTDRHVSFGGADDVPEAYSSPPSVQSPEGTLVHPPSRPLTPVRETPLLPAPGPVSRRATRAKQILALSRNFLTPASVTMVFSIVIALVKPLKALFVPVADFAMPTAPDGEPPLAFIYDFATFMGAASVPLGLICLGSALARLNVPRSQWRTLPLGAIMTMAIGKMILMPVLGVLICTGLIHANVIWKDDKVLQFVCIFFSCLPTATTQVLVTQVYSNTGSAEHLAPFLIPQYIIMLLSMTALSAYTLQMLF